MTERFLQVLEWSGQSKYLKANKTVWKIGDDLAGYIRAVNNFYQVCSVLISFLYHVYTYPVKCID